MEAVVCGGRDVYKRQGLKYLKDTYGAEITDTDSFLASV